MTYANRAISTWLIIVALTVIAMIVVGGVTRLTESGLSIVEWQPIVGIVPPLNDAEWNTAFDAYKAYPQYQQVNQGMDLAGFKEIFYWEYAHRVLGRVIGVLFFVPFVYFWLRGMIAPRLRPFLIGALVLGGLQGLLGWYMVKSGLIDMPRVSHYRLAAHLMLALFILAYLSWLVLGLWETRRVAVSRGFRVSILVISGLVVLQILYGAFTAGIRAGYGYNTFPLMQGKFMADAVFFMEPWWINLFESGATIQFIHRWLGSAVLLAAFALWLAGRRQGRQIRWASACLLAAILIQFTIGVLTLIHVVPVGLASFHQGWVCMVLLALVYLVFVTAPARRVDWQ